MDTPPATSLVNPPRVAIVGGGLAGLAAAVTLSERGIPVELFEAKRHLGGRAGSYVDQETGELLDHCQHVALGCCTNFLDFAERTGIADLFERHRTLYFLGLAGEQSVFRPSHWLPAPLHLVPALWGLKHLTLPDKVGIARAMLRLGRLPAGDAPDAPSVLDWLVQQRQSRRSIERFWQVVLVSALGESLARASLTAARKVFVDGFLAHSAACDVLVPRVSLGELYDRRVAGWLRERGARIHLETPIEALVGDASRVTGLLRKDGQEQPLDLTIVAVPWRRAAELLAPALRSQMPRLAAAAEFAAAPIASVHLWFDRPITDLPHAVLVGRLSQWMFARSQHDAADGASAGQVPSYYQVVISASHDLAGRERQAIVDEVVSDLGTVFPVAREARLVRWKLIVQPDAVFSVRPGLERLRPSQTTPIENLVLAGDWTATGWPATMEGAVRSGYLAAEAVLAQCGRPERLVVADLRRGWLVKALGISAQGPSQKLHFT